MPAGLEGVVVAETTIGDVRGQEGFFHYRQYSAVDLAEKRSLEDVWHLLFHGELPDAAASAAFAAEVRRRRALPPGLAHGAAGRVPPGRAARRAAHRGLAARRPSSAGAPRTTSAPTSSYDQALGLCAVVPTILAAAHRLRQGRRARRAA